MEIVNNFYENNIANLVWVALAGFLIPLIIFIKNGGEFKQWNLKSISNTICFWFSWPLIILFCAINSIWEDSIKSEWVKTIDYDLVSLRNVNTSSTSGSVDGVAILGTGVMSGQLSTNHDYKFSFYIKGKDGMIDRVVVNHTLVRFKESDDISVVRSAKCYTKNSGESFYLYRNIDSRHSYVISLPLDKFDQHINVSH